MKTHPKPEYGLTFFIFFIALKPNQLLTFLFLINCLFSYGELLRIDASTSQGNIQDHFSALIDTSGQLTVDQLLDKEFKIKGESNYGFSEHVHWLKGDIQINSDKIEEWFLEVDYPHLDTVEFFLFNENKQIAHLITGDAFPFYTREIEATGFIFPINLTPKTTYKVLIRVRTTSDVEIPINIAPAHAYEHQKFPVYLLFGFYYGVLAVMFLYNLIISLTLQDVNYKYYSISILATLLFMLAYNGHGYEFIWSNSPVWNSKSVGVFLCLTAIFVVLITEKFLALKQYHKKLHQVFKLFFYINCALLAYNIFSPTAVKHQINLGFIGIQIPVAIVAGIVAWKKGNESAKYFTLAWIIYQIGGSMAIGKSMGMYPANVFTNYGVYVGSVLEIVLLSFALSYRYGKIKREREETQKRIIEMQKAANEELENKVALRTAELNSANESLQETIEDLDEQKHLVDEKNKHIMDSIRYAETIQSALLPSSRVLDFRFKDHFIMYQPKDMVSGDFYWFGEVGTKMIFASIDCTGHGVPGAMLTIAANSMLENIVHQNRKTRPDEILEELDKLVKNSISQHEGSNAMDLAVIAIDEEQQTFQFSGAFTDIYVKKNTGFEELKGTKRLIGSEDYSDKNFKLLEFPLQDIQTVYLYSDGYKDQFGHKLNKKFMRSKFLKVLASNSDRPMIEQLETLHAQHFDWRGEEEQTDDILVVGLKLN